MTTEQLVLFLLKLKSMKQSWWDRCGAKNKGQCQKKIIIKFQVRDARGLSPGSDSPFYLSYFIVNFQNKLPSNTSRFILTIRMYFIILLVIFSTIILNYSSDLSSGMYCRVKWLGTLMMEAARTSKTSVDNYFTWQYIPEDKSELHTRCRENLKSHLNYSI
jgi:hypothetical protein